MASKKRRLTEDEKRQRRNQRSADKKNARDLAQAPLFAPILPHRTASTEYWAWRRNVARMAGEHSSTHKGEKLLDEIREAEIRRYVRQVVGAEAFAKLDDYRWRTYPKHDYGYGFWERVLTGHRIQFAYRQVENRQPGQPAVICTDWYECQHMTREEYFEMFPYKDPQPPAQDDAGLEAMVDAALAHSLTPRSPHP